MHVICFTISISTLGISAWLSNVANHKKNGLKTVTLAAQNGASSPVRVLFRKVGLDACIPPANKGLL